MAQSSTHDFLAHTDDSGPIKDPIVQSERGIVASEDQRCSKIGVSILEQGGNAVDAAIATTLALGVVSQMWSGIGGGDFIVIHPSSGCRRTVAINARETAPAAASEDMYADNPTDKSRGARSVAVPGKIAGMYYAWNNYGKLNWESLFKPAIKLAREGFKITKFQGDSIAACEKVILGDPGLRHVYAPRGKVLKAGDTCYNIELANAMEEIAEHRSMAFYGGVVGRKFVEDLRKVGGIITLDDMKKYEVHVTDALEVNAMGFTIYGMPPPSAGTVGLAMVLNILQSYGSPTAFDGPEGLHRLIEALKHMSSIRTGLGDPVFADIRDTVSKMLSPANAEKIRERILDYSTFPPFYYCPIWNQSREHGTSHLCVVDEERNVVSLTASVNYDFGSGVLSPSTGIVLNNQMDDFSIPTEVYEDNLPPGPANFIRPGKRPLSSMTPIIIFKGNKFVGALGASGGITITPGVIQVFLNYFISKMKPLPAMKEPRVYHRLIPNVVFYEDWTVVTDEHITLSKDKIDFLKSRGHDLQNTPFLLVRENNKLHAVSVGEFRNFMALKGSEYNVEDAKKLYAVAVGEYHNFASLKGNSYNLKDKHRLHAVAAGAYCNLVVQDEGGMLTAVSDIRKGGFPASL